MRKHNLSAPQKWCINKIKTLQQNKNSTKSNWVHRLDIMCNLSTLNSLVKWGYLNSLDGEYFQVKEQGLNDVLKSME